ncbi:hypothetical protein [Pontibacter sp. H249]|uniref:hypothetical protein n=1 Tax=Pontibacter sp. H249 TaxID=3133420 RepID=UPI0030BDB036
MTFTSHIELQLENAYQDDFLLAEIDKAFGFMRVTWYCHPNSQEFRRLFEILVNLVIKHKIKYWLSKSTAILYLEFSDQNWVLDHVIPPLRLSGLTKYARITTKECMTLMDVSRIISNLDQEKISGSKLTLEQFLTEEDALDWLLSELE